VSRGLSVTAELLVWVCTLDSEPWTAVPYIVLKHSNKLPFCVEFDTTQLVPPSSIQAGSKRGFWQKFVVDVER